MKYRLKPLEVDVITFEELDVMYKEILYGSDGSDEPLIPIDHGKTTIFRHKKGRYRIPTSSGFIGMMAGDILVESSTGQLSVWHPDEFHAKYEAIDNV